MREIVQFDLQKDKIRFQSAAIAALQQAAEAHCVRVLEDAGLLALHGGRVTVQQRDMDLARYLRGEILEQKMVLRTAKERRMWGERLVRLEEERKVNEAKLVKIREEMDAKALQRAVKKRRRQDERMQMRLAKARAAAAATAAANASVVDPNQPGPSSAGQ